MIKLKKIFEINLSFESKKFDLIIFSSNVRLLNFINLRYSQRLNK